DRHLDADRLNASLRFPRQFTELIYRAMPEAGAGRVVPAGPPMPVVALGALYGSKFAACLSSSLVMEIFSLSDSFLDLSPATSWKALGAIATSLVPMPRKPPTPTT